MSTRWEDAGPQGRLTKGDGSPDTGRSTCDDDDLVWEEGHDEEWGFKWR